MEEPVALALSAAIEAPIAYLIVRLAKWPSRGALHVALAAAVATAVTHPQLWSTAFWAYARFPYWPSVFALESLVIAVEGLLIAWMAELAISRALFVSLIVNSASCLFGLLIERLRL